MIDVIVQPEHDNAPGPTAGKHQPLDERCCWLPPHRMLRYQWAKAVGGSVMIAIFAGWMHFQWESVLSRVVTGAMMLFTLAIVVSSILADLRRGRGRQLAIDGGDICLIRPDDAARVDLAQVNHAQWINEPQARMGLWLFDAQARPLLHIDGDLIADESEARDFVRWARQLTGLPFETRWPAAPAL